MSSGIKTDIVLQGLELNLRLVVYSGDKDMAWVSFNQEQLDELIVNLQKEAERMRSARKPQVIVPKLS